MSEGLPRLMGGLERAMRHLADRQQVIAGNIANSETPGYRARELDAPDFSDLLSATGSAGGAPRVNRPTVSLTPGMVAMGARAPTAQAGHEDRDISEVKPDGNTVTLEDQLLKMGSIQADYAAAAASYGKSMALLRKASGRGGS